MGEVVDYFRRACPGCGTPGDSNQAGYGTTILRCRTRDCRVTRFFVRSVEANENEIYVRPVEANEESDENG